MLIPCIKILPNFRNLVVIEIQYTLVIDVPLCGVISLFSLDSTFYHY